MEIDLSTIKRREPRVKMVSARITEDNYNYLVQNNISVTLFINEAITILRNQKIKGVAKSILKKKSKR